jgi:N-acetylglutamate synthase-like GNAT family acetyltransferase
MEFLYLADHPQFLPTVAAWHHSEWGYIRPGDTVEARQKRLEAECGHREIPTTIIALEKGKLLGSVSLLDEDMDTHKELTPWLASLFVAVEKRGQGIGAALVRRLIEEARELEVKRLYLYTPDQEKFYTRLDWSLLERTNYAGKPAVIMAYAISPDR